MSEVALGAGSPSVAALSGRPRRGRRARGRRRALWRLLMGSGADAEAETRSSFSEQRHLAGSALMSALAQRASCDLCARAFDVGDLARRVLRARHDARTRDRP